MTKESEKAILMVIFHREVQNAFDEVQIKND